MGAQLQPFTGLKVLDFTWVAAGPVVTTYLGFLGADVVKVEHSARPDLMRVSDKQYGYGNDRGINDSPLFNELAAGKRSIELDLNNPADQELAKQLAAKADVLVENMRPGKIDKFGLSYEQLSKANPGLIMCSISATGRLSVEAPPGYAPIFWAEGGGAWMTGWPDRNPGLVRGPIDLHVAAFACLGLLSLLHQRKRTGKGGYLDCSAIEAVAATVGVHLLEEQCGVSRSGRDGNKATGMLVNDVFPCAGEDQWVAISLFDEGDAETFAGVMRDTYGADLLASDMHGIDGWERIASVTRDIDVASLAGSLSNAGLASARSTSMLVAMEDRYLLERGALQTINHQTIGDQLIIGLPWMVDGERYRITKAAPNLGEDKPGILGGWLGRKA